jgi:predicted RNA-binding Zn-ribbon protein involved in translation (DUF1610 family)
MAREKTQLTLRVPGIGNVLFVAGRNKALDTMYDEPSWRPLCPKCEKEIPPSGGKIRTSTSVFVCPSCGLMEPESVVKAHPINQERKMAWDAAHTRTLDITVTQTIPREKLPEFIQDNDSIEYLVPMRTTDNLDNWKRLISLLITSNSVALTTPVRSRLGSASAHRKLITVSKKKHALVIMDMIPQALVREPNIDAVFETFPEPDAATKKAKKELEADKDEEIIKITQ